jgi:hypothetical protein
MGASRVNEDHKSDEREALERFRSAWEGRDEITSVDPGNWDSPDVRGMLTDDRPFGMEVVTVTDQGLAHAASLLKDKLKPELEAAVTAASLNGTLALCFGEWQERPLADRARRRKFVADVVEFARGAGGKIRETYDEDGAQRRKLIADLMGGKDDADDPSGVPDGAVVVDGVEKVIFEPAADGGVDVLMTRNGWGRGVNEIQACITRKDEKAGEYRRNLAAGAQLWLLLVAGTTYADGVLAPPRQMKFDSKFDRVFFLDHWPVRSGRSTDKVVELPLRRLHTDASS